MQKSVDSLKTIDLLKKIEQEAYKLFAKCLFWIILLSMYGHLNWFIRERLGVADSNLLAVIAIVFAGAMTYHPLCQRIEKVPAHVAEQTVCGRYVWVALSLIGTLSAGINLDFFFEYGKPIKLLTWLNTGEYNKAVAAVFLSLIIPLIILLYIFALPNLLQIRYEETEKKRQRLRKAKARKYIQALASDDLEDFRSEGKVMQVYQTLSEIPNHLAGIYFLWRGNQLDYIGQSKRIAKRLKREHKVYSPDTHTISIIAEPELEQRLSFESYLIRSLNPAKNIADKPANSRRARAKA